MWWRMRGCGGGLWFVESMVGISWIGDRLECVGERPLFFFGVRL